MVKIFINKFQIAVVPSFIVFFSYFKLTTIVKIIKQVNILLHRAPLVYTELFVSQSSSPMSNSVSNFFFYEIISFLFLCFLFCKVINCVCSSVFLLLLFLFFFCLGYFFSFLCFYFCFCFCIFVYYF